MTSRSPRPVAAVLVAAVLVLAGCGDDDADVASETTPTSTTTTTAATADTSPAEDTTTTTAESAGTVVEVTVENGEVTGGGRHEVPLGETVTLLVTSDVADHVHLHGYDVFEDVGAGETAELTFEADIPGVFEVELEDSVIPLVELEVS